MKKKEIVFVSRIIHAFVFVKIVSKDIIITRNIHAYVYFYLLFLKKKERIDTLWIIRRRRGELPPQQRHESSGIDVLERGESVMETIKNKKKFFALRKAPYIAISLSHTHTHTRVNSSVVVFFCWLREKQKFCFWPVLMICSEKYSNSVETRLTYFKFQRHFSFLFQPKW